MGIREKIKNENYIDFGQWLYELRTQKEYDEYELAEKINKINVQAKNIKKWERDLEFPDLDTIYKLSEIYMIPSSEIIDKKNQTLQAGVNGVNMFIIRILSLIMGISIYSAVAFYYVTHVIAIIIGMLAFKILYDLVFN